jgi:uncharacterized protein (DUF1499 family)
VVRTPSTPVALAARRAAPIAALVGVAASLLLAGCSNTAAYERFQSPVSHLDPRLAPCPQSPNCVSSQAWNPDQRVPPFTFVGTAADALATLAALIEADPAARIVEQRSGIYLHAEYRSRWLHFVDDLELAADEEAGVVHVRSASRRGWSDFGVNRRRVEALHRAFAEAILPIP